MRMVVLVCCLPRLVVSLFRQMGFIQVSVSGRIASGDLLALDRRDRDDLGPHAFTLGPSALDLDPSALERTMTLQPFLQDVVDFRHAEFPVTSELAMQGQNEFDSLRSHAQFPSKLESIKKFLIQGDHDSSST